MILTESKGLMKNLCIKLKKVTTEVVKNVKSKCEIEVNELKIEDGEGEHDLEVDGTLVKMKTAFVKIRNRSTLSLTDIGCPDLSNKENVPETFLEESLKKIISEEKIPGLGEGWRKEIVRRSPKEAVIVCVKTPGNVVLESVVEAEKYLHNVGIKGVDVKKLFASPPTPTKSKNREGDEDVQVKKTTTDKETTDVVKNTSSDKTVLPGLEEHNLDEKNYDCTNVQPVSETVEPDSVASDTQKTTTTCSADKIEDRKEINMTEEHDCADKDTKDQEEKDISSSKVSKKRKLVQTNLFAFMGQGQSTKKAKLDHPQESPLDNVTEKDKIDETIADCMDPNQGCTSNNVTDSELQSGKSVPELDSNSSVEE